MFARDVALGEDEPSVPDYNQIYDVVKAHLQRIQTGHLNNVSWGDFVKPEVGHQNDQDYGSEPWRQRCVTVTSQPRLKRITLHTSAILYGRDAYI